VPRRSRRRSAPCRHRRTPHSGECTARRHHCGRHRPLRRFRRTVTSESRNAHGRFRPSPHPECRQLDEAAAPCDLEKRHRSSISVTSRPRGRPRRQAALSPQLHDNDQSYRCDTPCADLSARVLLAPAVQINARRADSQNLDNSRSAHARSLPPCTAKRGGAHHSTRRRSPVP
jgi:hypothetical protein